MTTDNSYQEWRPDPKVISHPKVKKGLKKEYKPPTGKGIMFLEVWKERLHVCENCKENLGNEPLAHFFSHISKDKKLELDKDNIQLLCRDCHYAFDFQGIDKFNARTK